MRALGLLGSEDVIFISWNVWKLGPRKWASDVMSIHISLKIFPVKLIFYFSRRLTATKSQMKYQWGNKFWVKILDLTSFFRENQIEMDAKPSKDCQKNTNTGLKKIYQMPKSFNNLTAWRSHQHRVIIAKLYDCTILKTW